MQARFIRTAVGLGLALLSALPSATAQAIPSARPSVAVPRVEVYGGYSYFRPYKADINNYYDAAIQPGAVGGVNYFFTRHYGFEAEGGLFPKGPNDCAATAEGGPVARWDFRRVVPFVHVLGGGVKLGGPVFQPCTWGWGGTGGVGMDLVVPGFGDRLAARLFQADYQYNYVDYGPLVLPGGFAGGLMKMNAYRLTAGIVLRFGNMSNVTPLGLSCSVQPGDVYAGEPVVATSETVNLDPRKKTTYSWKVSGGKLSGPGETVQIDTAGLQPGNYTLTGRAIQGPTQEQQAECMTYFSIKGEGASTAAPGVSADGPSISCSASPGSIHPGEVSIITAVATSPQNRALTYSYTASAGVITGSTNTATLTTSGATTGAIQVTCNVVDDQGKSASATATVQMLPAPVPPAPKTEQLCTIAFDRDKKRPARVDNEAKGCLDDIALTLQRQSDATLVMVGSHDPGESPDVAAQRTVNTKLYLTREKGIDGARIQLRTGGDTERRVFHTLVPSGASFADEGTLAVDESTVKTVGQPYGIARPRAARPARRRTGVSSPPAP